jgi:hypothetical protein
LEFASKEGKLDAARRMHRDLKQDLMKLVEQLRRMLEGWEAVRSKDEEEKELRDEPDRELLARLSLATGSFNSNETEEVLWELERYRYEKGRELVGWLREQAENFDYDAMHRRLEEFLGNN